MVRASPKCAVAECGRSFADIVDANILVPSVRPNPFRHADAVPIAERVHRRSDPGEIKTILPARRCRTHRGPALGVQRPMIHKARERGDPRSLRSGHPSGKMRRGQRLAVPTRRRRGISRDRRGCDPIEDRAEFPHSGAHCDRARTSLGAGDLSQRVGAQTLPMINALRGHAERLRPRQLRAVIEVHHRLEVGDFERAQTVTGAIRARPQHQAGVGTAHTRLPDDRDLRDRRHGMGQPPHHFPRLVTRQATALTGDRSRNVQLSRTPRALPLAASGSPVQIRTHTPTRRHGARLRGLTRQERIDRSAARAGHIAGAEARPLGHLLQPLTLDAYPRHQP